MIKTATILTLATQATLAHDFKACADAKDDLKVTAVTLNPDPPKLGAKIDVTFNGGPVAVDITSGKAALAQLNFTAKLSLPPTLTFARSSA